MKYLLFLLVIGSASAVELDYDKLQRMSNKDIAKMVERENWLLRFQFGQLQALNEYAITRGWKPPTVAPLCVEKEIAPLPKLPEWKPVLTNGQVSNMEGEMGKYVKTVMGLYNQANRDLEDSIDEMHADCQY